MCACARACVLRACARVPSWPAELVLARVKLAFVPGEDGVYKTTLVGQSMYCTLQYPGSWSIFVSGQGMNVLNLFSGNNSQGFQGMDSSTASASSSSTSTAPPVPDPTSSALSTSVTRLPSSSCEATILSDDTLVSNCSEY